MIYDIVSWQIFFKKMHSTLFYSFYNMVLKRDHAFPCAYIGATAINFDFSAINLH